MIPLFTDASWKLSSTSRCQRGQETMGERSSGGWTDVDTLSLAEIPSQVSPATTV